ncbi:threonine synthase [Aliikangiella coralliicola]|uniref:Threonine synthase n=1 Tax=Aliikangiella coralliicola TaxID=2592383 RepID=A0A545U801_9GAMM|nr:threonine synthase [Aliikangiella coralliicola]TQV85533.1 threonine synthase [Aliikangiella coralliicola]
MSYVSKLCCTYCATTYPKTDLMNLCPKDGRPLEIIIDVAKVKEELPEFSWYRPQLKSMWRFGSLLALDINNEQDRRNIVSLGEGYTPEIPLHQHPLAKKHHFNLFLKDEGQPHKNFGSNPTGSFKDRGMSMAISMAKQFGVKKVVVPTQGNAGDSLAEYAMKANMESVVIMPDDTPMPILGRVSALAKMHDNVTIELVKGTIKEAGQLMKEKYVPQGYFNMATFQEPGWRIDGKKTLGLELAEPNDGLNQAWSLPDVVLYPTGGGTGILGMWKAFDELQALGLIGDKRPRVISVQSEKTAPVVNAFDSNQDDSTIVEAGETIATGLNVPGGVGHFKVLDIIRKSRGAALAVDENSIKENLKSIYHNYGIWICPEGAATLAAIEPAIERGLIQSGDKVVAFNTGSFEKYLPNVRKLLFV